MFSFSNNNNNSDNQHVPTEDDPIVATSVSIEREREPISFSFRKLLIFIISFIVVVLILVALFFSFATLDPTELGLDYNGITGNCNTRTTYGPGGLHFIWLGHYFVKYPKVWVTLEFSTNRFASAGPVMTRTVNAVPITLSFSFQYRFIPAKLGQLYEKYARAYESTMIKVARNAILQVAGLHDSEEYWLARQNVSNAMLAELQVVLKQNMFVEITMFQFLNITLPTRYESSIIQTQVQQQMKLTQEKVQRVREIQYQIQELMAETQKNITIIESEAQALSISIQNDAATRVLNFTEGIKADALKKIADKLNLNPADLLQYIKIRTIKKKQMGKQTTIGLHDQELYEL